MSYNETSHRKVCSTVSLGPPVTPEAFGESNFSDESSSIRVDLHRVMIRWSKCPPNVGVQLGARPLITSVHRGGTRTEPRN